MEKSKQHARSDTQEYYGNINKHEYYTMAKVVSVISYLTLIGWLIAMALYGKHKSCATSFHLRQSLGLIITGALPAHYWLLFRLLVG